MNRNNHNPMQNNIESLIRAKANECNAKLIGFNPFECKDSNIYHHFLIDIEIETDNFDSFMDNLENLFPNISWALTDEQSDNANRFRIECAI